MYLNLGVSIFIKEYKITESNFTIVECGFQAKLKFAEEFVPTLGVFKGGIKF